MLETVGLVIVAGIAIREIARRRRRVALLESARREVFRNRFGRIRTEMMLAVADGEIDPRSPYFRSLYRLLTPLMRHPERYEEASSAVLHALGANSSAREQSIERPTHLEARILLDAANALDDLISTYVASYRVMRRGWHLLRGGLGLERVPMWALMFAARSPAYRRVKAARQVSQRMQARARMVLEPA